MSEGTVTLYTATTRVGDAAAAGVEGWPWPSTWLQFSAVQTCPPHHQQLHPQPRVAADQLVSNTVSESKWTASLERTLCHCFSSVRHRFRTSYSSQAPLWCVRGHGIPPQVKETTVCGTTYKQWCEPLRDLHRRWLQQPCGIRWGEPSEGLRTCFNRELGRLGTSPTTTT